MQALVRTYQSRVFHAAASVTLIAVWIAGAQWAAADGGEIAYIANDRASIHVVQADGTGDRQLVSAGAINNIAWSPDGKVLAYTTVSQALAAQRIYLFDTGAGRSTELKSSVATYGPIAFFPDGKRLAAPDGEGPTLFCDGKTVAIDLSTGQSMPLGPAMNRCVSHLQVTPDGAALIATMHGGDPSSGIANVVLPSGQQNWIDDPSTGVLGFSGAVTLDNQTLAYITLPLNDLSDPGKLVLADRDGSNQRVAWQPEQGEQLRNLDFAPDGGQLAVGVLRDSSFASLDEDIWVVGTDGGSAQKVAAGFDPAWRPGQASGVTPSSGQASPPPADASALPPVVAGQPQVINCSQGRLIGQGVVSYDCDDRMVYQVNPDLGILTRYDPSDGASEPTGMSWPITLDQSGVSWTDDRGRACLFGDFGQNNVAIQCSGGEAAPGSSPSSNAPTDALPPRDAT